MPRIPPQLFRKASRYSPDAAALLPACRDIQSALNELRWLREHVNQTSFPHKEKRISELCHRRGRGVPLQYILGSQPFGPLDIRCKPGVLIPRPETEAYTYHLVELIKSGDIFGNSTEQGKDDLRIADFCTGTGCIPLLLFRLLQRSFDRLDICGIDISPDAINLAKGNIIHNKRLGLLHPANTSQSLNFHHGNIFEDAALQLFGSGPLDILVSNPPYISEDVWNYGRGDIAYSVRKFEPRLALVPHDSLPLPVGWSREDVFYSRLFDCAQVLGPRVVLLEVGDERQALRVLSSFSKHELAARSHVELWRDSPDIVTEAPDQSSVEVSVPGNQKWVVPVKGSGQVRSICVRILKSSDESPNI